MSTKKTNTKAIDKEPDHVNKPSVTALPKNIKEPPKHTINSRRSNV